MLSFDKMCACYSFGSVILGVLYEVKKRTPYVETTSVGPVCRTVVKFSIGVVYKKLSRKRAFG